MAMTSVLAFLGGWLMLAHAPKPVQARAVDSGTSSFAIQALPTLEPLDLGQGSDGALSNAPLMSIQPGFRRTAQLPLFATGGS
jgi:hypothetical protein